MKQITERVIIQTRHADEMINVTSQVIHILQSSKIKKGFIVLFVPHTTAAVTINENADPDVKSDLLLGLREAFPTRSKYRHFEGNSHAHIKSSVVGVDQTILVEDGKLLLGTWQGVYFCEFDGPRQRSLYIKVMGEE